MKIVDINKPSSSPFSSRVGTIMCSYEKLCTIFGDPKDGLDYKSDYEWTLNMDNGDHINIYDWKIGKKYLGEESGLDKEDINIWNIGSNNSNLFSFLTKLINSEDWGGFEKTRMKMFMSEELISFLAEEC